MSEDRLMIPGRLRDESQKDVVVGGHYAPAWESVAPMLNRLQQVYGGANDPRSQLLASMAYHHRLAFVHPFEDGNSRVVQMATHLQVTRIGLGSPLWSTHVAWPASRTSITRTSVRPMKSAGATWMYMGN